MSWRDDAIAMGAEWEAERRGMTVDWFLDIEELEADARDRRQALSLEWDDRRGEGTHDVAHFRCPVRRGCVLGVLWASSIGYALAVRANRARLILDGPGERHAYELPRKLKLKSAENSAMGLPWSVFPLNPRPGDYWGFPDHWRCDHMVSDTAAYEASIVAIRDRYPHVDAAVPRRAPTGIIDAAGHVSWLA